MLEQLVSRFYSDDWEPFATQQGNRMIQENLFRARDCLATPLWARISDGWFHDAYITQFHCNNADSLTVHIRKRDETVELCFSSIISLECHGALLDRTASFPCAGADKPMAQILDIWVEQSEKLSMIILLDNGRYLQIICPSNQTIVLR